MTRLRIGIDAWGMSGDALYTGIGQYTRHLIAGLACHRDTDVVAYGAPRELPPAWLPAGVTWRTPELPVPRRIAALATRRFALRAEAKRDGLDVCHAPAVHVRPSLPPVPAVDCPLVVTVHDVIPLTYYGGALPARLRWFYRWNLRRAMRAAAVVTVSESARQEIGASVAPPPSSVTVIHNGVAFEPSADAGVLERYHIARPYVLYAGSYEPRKNLRGALDAYAQLVREGARYAFVGIVDAGSGHRPAAMAHLRSLDLGERVMLLEALSDSDLRALYSHAEAVLFPSFAEGFGFPPLQAAVCGVPAVVSDIPALRETMDGAAVFVDPARSDSIAAGLRRVLDGADTSRAMAVRAQKRAAAFTWQRSVEQHVEAYMAAAGAKLLERGDLQAAGVR